MGVEPTIHPPYKRGAIPLGDTSKSPFHFAPESNRLRPLNVGMHTSHTNQLLGFKSGRRESNPRIHAGNVVPDRSATAACDAFTYWDLNPHTLSGQPLLGACVFLFRHRDHARVVWLLAELVMGVEPT